MKWTLMLSFTVLICGCSGSFESKKLIAPNEDPGLLTPKSKPEKAGKTESHTPTNLNQLGSSWDQNYTRAFHLNHSMIFRAFIQQNSTNTSSANFILLKKIDAKNSLFITNIHTLSQSCDGEDITFLSKENEFLARCTQLYSIVPETDSVIFSVAFYDPTSSAEMNEASISTSHKYGEKLRFYGIALDDVIPNYFPLMSDSSADCRLLSFNEKRIADPDSLQKIEGKLYWSLAISCDVQHGDSGGMVVNRDNELVGVLWTGAFPKKNISTETLLKYSQNPDSLSEDARWTSLNYIVPYNRISEHLDRIVEDLSL